MNKYVEVSRMSWQADEDEVDVKSKALVDLEFVPTLSPNDMMELERHE